MKERQRWITIPKVLDTTAYNKTIKASSTAQNHIRLRFQDLLTLCLETVNIDFKLSQDAHQAEQASVGRASEHRLVNRMTSRLEVVDAIINAGGSHMCWTTTR